MSDWQKAAESFADAEIVRTEDVAAKVAALRAKRSRPAPRPKADSIRDQLKAAVASAESRSTQVARRSRLHGPRHWRDVARVALELHLATSKGRPVDLFLFALLHDSQRVSEGLDPDHGARAAKLLAELGEGPVGGTDLDALASTLTEHDRGRTSRQATRGACWDADRLLLSRCAIRPEAEYLSLPEVRDDLERWTHFAEQTWRSDDQPWATIADAYAAAIEPRDGRWYHGGPAGVERITPPEPRGGESHLGSPEFALLGTPESGPLYRRDHVYVTSDPEHAYIYAMTLANKSNQPASVYEVEPEGPLEKDPGAPLDACSTPSATVRRLVRWVPPKKRATSAVVEATNDLAATNELVQFELERFRREQRANPDYYRRGARHVTPWLRKRRSPA